MEAVKIEPNDFAVALYARLGQARRNLCFSPFSLRTALAMSLIGARGETEAQMREALRFAATGAELHSILARMTLRLTEPSDGGYEMAVANSLWVQEGMSLLPEFLRSIHLYYGSDVKQIDFSAQAELGRSTINQWVEDQTRNRIRDLIPSGGVDEMTGLVIVNAVYFMGTWARKFIEEATHPAPFHLESGQQVDAPLMFQEDHFHYAKGPGFQAVDLAYENSDVSMLVLLPDRRDGLADLETRMTSQLIHDCTHHLGVQKVRLFLPRFRMSWGTVDLRRPLGALGMVNAFDEATADFSGINGHRPPHPDALSISRVFHKAFVDVDEAGTRAAAATAVEGALLGRSRVRPPEPITFRADHPFLFVIRDQKSDAMLFMGRMLDPSRVG